jgi:hypothetical protein
MLICFRFFSIKRMLLFLHEEQPAVLCREIISIYYKNYTKLLRTCMGKVYSSFMLNQWLKLNEFLFASEFEMYTWEASVLIRHLERRQLLMRRSAAGWTRHWMKGHSRNIVKKTDDLKETGQLTWFEAPRIRRWTTPHHGIVVTTKLAYRM